MRTISAWVETECGAAERPVLVASERPPASGRSLRLLDKVRDATRARHLSRRTEKASVAWVRRDGVLHRKRHPCELRSAEIARFLTTSRMGPAGVRSPADQAVTDAAAALPDPATQPGYADRPRSIAPGRFRG